MNKIIDDLIVRYPVLTECRAQICELTARIISVYENGGRLFVAGNGGSCADADHIAGELLKSFRLRRHVDADERGLLVAEFGADGEKLASVLEPALPCVALHSQIGFVTAFWNDVGADYVYAQQLYAQSRPGDMFIGISTSGGSVNIRYALMAAKLRMVNTALLTGNRHGVCEKYAELAVTVPASEPYLVQEFHLPIYHAVCLAVEEHFYGK
ncbi:MAG: SIS domain-containing protein [Victivallaceae bacterium]|nr:SIS domain-containing protein [Victivallaceae bacterium]